LSLVRGECQEGKWKRDITKTNIEPIRDQNIVAKERLLLQCHLSPGDVITLTAAVRDLHRAYPGRFLTGVDTTAGEIWDHNPHITKFSPEELVRKLQMHYPLINQSNQRPVHFLSGYVDFLNETLKLNIPLTAFKGDIHLSNEEKSWKNQIEEEFGYKGPFWIIIAGGKYDFTTKWWSPSYAQEVIDHFRGRLQFVQCGEESHWHPKLAGVYNLIGKTSIRQFIRLVYHSAGIICPVTFAMHLAAAIPTHKNRLRPCVVIAGGREPAHWEAYPGHQFLHTIGQLSCCATGGCWKSRCQRANDNDLKDKENLCERPIPVNDRLHIAQCMMMIRPSLIIDAVERSLAFDDYCSLNK